MLHGIDDKNYGTPRRHAGASHILGGVIMRSTKIGLVIGMAILVIVMASSASALPTFLKVVKDTYAVKTGGQIDAAKCALCHSSPMKGDTLNPFGMNLKAAL